MGIPRAEVEGARLLDLLPGEHGSGMLALYTQALELDGPLVLDDFVYPFELEGSRRRYDIRAAKVGDGLSFAWRDVTERHDGAVALAESEAQFRLLAENAADVVMLFDSADHMVWASPSTHRLLGYEPAELLGPVRSDLLHPLDLPKVQAAVEVLRSGRRLTVTQDVRLRRRDGQYRWWQATGRRTMDDHLTSDIVLALRDIDGEVAARTAVAEEQQRRASIIESMIDPYLLLRVRRDMSKQVVDFVIEDANCAARAAFGDPKTTLIGRRIKDAAPGLMFSEVFDPLLETLDGGTALVMDDARYAAADGSTIWIDVRAVPLGSDRLSLTWRNVSKRHDAARALAESEERFRLLADNLGDVLLALTPARTVTYASTSARDVLGWNPDLLIGTPMLDLAHPEDRPTLTACLEGSDKAADGIASARVRMRHADDSYRWMGFVIREVRGAGGQAVSAVVTMRDIHTQVLAESALQHEAATDALTGLMNRRELTQRVQRLLAREHGMGLAVLFLDVDVLKTINDNHGHAVGDAVIAFVADRLRSVVRSDDLVARIGGDEFVVVLTGTATVDAALRIASRIHGLMQGPIDVGAKRIRASLSIGVAMVGPDDDPASAFARADAAMYEAKRQGHGSTAVSRG